MILIKCIITLVIVALGVCAVTMTTTRHRSLYILHGYFFHRLPIAAADITSRHPIEAPNGTKAIALVTDKPVSEIPLHDALPAAVIPESDFLLRQYRIFLESPSTSLSTDYAKQ